MTFDGNQWLRGRRGSRVATRPLEPEPVPAASDEDDEGDEDDGPIRPDFPGSADGGARGGTDKAVDMNGWLRGEGVGSRGEGTFSRVITTTTEEI